MADFETAIRLVVIGREFLIVLFSGCLARVTPDQPDPE